MKNGTSRRYRVLLIFGAAALAALAFVCLGLGQYRIPPSQVARALLGKETTDTVRTVLFNMRIPRILMAALSGAALAEAGVAFQALFSNPLATPDTLGTANGASFGAALGILLGLGSAGTQVLALSGGIGAVALVLLVTTPQKGRSRSIISLVLAGLVISTLFSSLVSLVKYTADPQDVLPSITYFLMGSLSSLTMQNFLRALPFLLSGMVLLFLLRHRMNTLSLPEEEARALGMNLPLVRFLVMLGGALVTASVVCVCGIIGWIGLLIPHLCRMLIGHDNARLLPLSMVFGALFLLIVDTVARCLTTAEMPVSILTSVIGAPVFIALLRATGGDGE